MEIQQNMIPLPYFEVWGEYAHTPESIFISPIKIESRFYHAAMNMMLYIGQKQTGLCMVV